MSRPFSSGLKGRGKSATDGNPEDCCQLLCKSSVLVVGGRGLRFVVSSSRGSYPAFVIRCRAGVSAFLNICAHMDLELDWTAGRFSIHKGATLSARPTVPCMIQPTDCV